MTHVVKFNEPKAQKSENNFPSVHGINHCELIGALCINFISNTKQ